jgi:hypothetical protein
MGRRGRGNCLVRNCSNPRVAAGDRKDGLPPINQHHARRRKRASNVCPVSYRYSLAHSLVWIGLDWFGLVWFGLVGPLTRDYFLKNRKPTKPGGRCETTDDRGRHTPTPTTNSAVVLVLVVGRDSRLQVFSIVHSTPAKWTVDSLYSLEKRFHTTSYCSIVLYCVVLYCVD